MQRDAAVREQGGSEQGSSATQYLVVENECHQMVSCSTCHWTVACARKMKKEKRKKAGKLSHSVKAGMKGRELVCSLESAKAFPIVASEPLHQFDSSHSKELLLFVIKDGS